jgi:hypothetical protein
MQELVHVLYINYSLSFSFLTSKEARVSPPPYIQELKSVHGQMDGEIYFQMHYKSSGYTNYLK